MEHKATPYSYSDWLLIIIAAQALMDLYTPNATFGGTVALVIFGVGVRFIQYLAERSGTVLARHSRVAAVALMALIFMAGIWFVPDIVMSIANGSKK
jgi:hypothetical protein